MVSLLWPWLFTLLPLPWLYRWWRKPGDQAAALYAPGYAADIQTLHNEGRQASSNWPRLLLLNLIWLCLIIAAARPTWIGDPVALPTSGRDLLLAVDISGSMDTRDMQSGDRATNRISAVKAVVGEFVERRSSDRLGLILFGTNAYLQAPLTFDRTTVNTLLQEALVGFAGKGTAIGDAIGLAVKRLRERPEASRVLILLTDGVNNAGEINPDQAAELAAAHGLKIYTIGVGASEILKRTLFGIRRLNPSADLDETALQGIAQKTGGRYFRARDPEELANIYAELDRLEPVAQEKEQFRPTKSLLHWPLAASFLGSLLLIVWSSKGLTLTDRYRG